MRQRLMSTLSAWLLCVLCVPTVAWAKSDPLEPVRLAFEEIRYREAAYLLDGVIRQGELSAELLSEAYRLGGELFAALADEQRARDYFAHWLTVREDAALPPGTSPKIATIFERVKAQVPAGLRVRAVSRRTREAVEVELAVPGDPLRLVAGVRVRYGAGAGHGLTGVAVADQSLRVSFAAPADAQVALRISALDVYGNEVLVVGNEVLAALPAVPVRTGVAKREGAHAQWYLRWYPYAALAGAAAGAGLFLGLRVRSAEDELSKLNARSATTAFSEAQQVEARGRRDARLANLAFGTAGLATLGAVVCGWLQRSERKSVVSTSGNRHQFGVDVRGSF